MTSTTGETTDAEPGASAPTEAAAPTHAITHRSWMVFVALVAAAAAVLALVLLSTADAAAKTTTAARTSEVTGTTPAMSVGASLLAMAWELTPPAGHAEACAQFGADPTAAWAAYSGAGDPGSLPTQPEFAAFLTGRC